MTFLKQGDDVFGGPALADLDEHRSLEIARAVPGRGMLQAAVCSNQEGAMEKPASTSSTPPISRFSVPELATLPEDIRDRILEVQGKAGFVPNVFLVLARRPDEFRAFFAYHDALMMKEGGLSKGEREMIVVATSSANQCHYCVIAHGAILRIYEKQPLIADQVAVNHRKADLTARQHAMLAFSMKVALRSQEIEDADFSRLREHGFTDEDAWDIAAIAAFFAMSNRLANMSGMRPNDEFYLMGRLPGKPRA